MRVLVLVAAAGACALAQSTVTTYRADYANGGFTQSSANVSSDHSSAQVTPSINGQQVPLEQHQSRIIREDANGSVTETTVKRYDPTGQLISTERTVTETRKTGGGGSTTVATTYHSDINGEERIAERDTTETKVSGNTATSNTVIEKSGVSWGTLQPVEKRSEVTQKEVHGKNSQSTTTESIYRGDAASGFREAERKVTSQTVTDGRVVDDTSDYEPGIDNDSLQFQERRVSTTVTAANGDRSTVVDVYAASADGTVRDPDRPPQIKQEQLITRVRNPDGSVVDTFSVREPSVSDPAKLGEARAITKTVCTGKCETPASAAAASPDAQLSK